MLHWKNSEAIAFFEEGLKNSTVTGDRSGITRNVSNLGSSYCNMEKYQKAIEYYKNCLELSTAIGDQSGIASNNCNLGNAYLSLGEYQKAIQYYEKGLESTASTSQPLGNDQSGIARGSVRNSKLAIWAMPISAWENIKKQFSIMKKV